MATPKTLANAGRLFAVDALGRHANLALTPNLTLVVLGTLALTAIPAIPGDGFHLIGSGDDSCPNNVLVGSGHELRHELTHYL